MVSKGLGAARLPAPAPSSRLRLLNPVLYYAEVKKLDISLGGNIRISNSLSLRQKTLYYLLLMYRFSSERQGYII